jgi:hypothetical protein
MQKPTPLRHAVFYILLKLHKSPIAGRPIVSSIATTTFYASRYLDRVLQPIMKSSFSFIRNSTDLILRLESSTYPTDCILGSADVINLYPSIDLQDGLHMLHIALRISPIKVENIPLLMDLAQFILFNNYLSFNDQVYLQLRGTAMGTPFAVTFACIYISMLEMETLKICQNHHIPLSHPHSYSVATSMISLLYSTTTPLHHSSSTLSTLSAPPSN